jgi:hypothetical protein
MHQLYAPTMEAFVPPQRGGSSSELSASRSLSFTPNEGPSEEGKITTLQTANRYYGIPLLDVSEFLNHSENSRLPHEVTPKLHPISKLELRSDFTVSSGPSDQVNLNWGCPFQAGQRWAQREV